MRSRFIRLLGNDETRLRLSDAVLGGTLPHALLIAGPRGSGKHTLAYEIAAAANCERRDDGSYALPCGKCGYCRRIYSGNFPDLSTLSREGGKATIGVEELRAFRADMFLSATESQYKFYIIEDADTMTPAAQNALLKVLEEPPRSVHILLLATETDKILSTIKSRTQHVQTELFEYEELRSCVTELSEVAEALSRSDPNRLRGILLASGGVIGRALGYLDDKSIAAIESDRDSVKKLVAAFSGKTPFSELYVTVTALPEKRGELRDILELLITALRDMITLKLSDNAMPLFFLSRDECEDAASGIGTKRLIAIYDIIVTAVEDIDKNVLIQPLLTDIAVKIKEV